MSDEEKVNEEVRTEEKPAYDKEKQQIEQDRASLAKQLAKTQRELTAEVTSSKEAIASIQSKLDAALNRAPGNTTEDTKLDPDIHGHELVDTIKSLKAELKKAGKDRAILQAHVESEKQAKANAEVKAAQEQAKEEVLEDLDEQFGAKYRNDAIAMANKELEETGADPPVSQMQAKKLLGKFYRKLKKQDDESAASKKTVRQDNLTGSISFGDDDIESGSLADVAAAMKKKGVFASMSLPGDG